MRPVFVHVKTAITNKKNKFIGKSIKSLSYKSLLWKAADAKKVDALRSIVNVIAEEKNVAHSVNAFNATTEMKIFLL